MLQVWDWHDKIVHNLRIEIAFDNTMCNVHYCNVQKGIVYIEFLSSFFEYYVVIEKVWRINQMIMLLNMCVTFFTSLVVVQ